MGQTAKTLEAAPAVSKIFKYPEIPPKGTDCIHPSMRHPFLAFLLNDGFLLNCSQTVFAHYLMNRPYLGKKKGMDEIIFVHQKREHLTIKVDGGMCTAAQQRYAVFLKMYLKHGAKFIQNLNRQIGMLRKAA